MSNPCGWAWQVDGTFVQTKALFPRERHFLLPGPAGSWGMLVGAPSASSLSWHLCDVHTGQAGLLINSSVSFPVLHGCHLWNECLPPRILRQRVPFVPLPFELLLQKGLHRTSIVYYYFVSSPLEYKLHKVKERELFNSLSLVWDLVPNSLSRNACWINERLCECSSLINKL